MPATLRIGDKGSDVVLCQQDLTKHGHTCTADGDFGPHTHSMVLAFQEDQGLSVDGIVGPATWAALSAAPEAPARRPRKRDWFDFVDLLHPAKSASYSLTGGQVPKFPPGVTFLSKKYLGEKYTNCSMFTAYFLGNGFKADFTLDSWLEWQIARGSDPSLYYGYGPGVVNTWGLGKIMPKGAVPKKGVYLLQTFSEWPRGHSWIVLDYEESTGKMLTLESNTKAFGLDGVGYADLGPVRSTHPKGWRDRVKTTWAARTKGYSQIHMDKLAIDHRSVRAWIAGSH